MIPAPKNLLVSFHYYKNWDLDRLRPRRIIGDSGAYSAKKIGAKVTTRQLAAWTKIWEHRLQWIASLDIAGDIEQTRKNWLRMVDEYQLPAVSTLHVGDPPEEMDWYAVRGVDFLGLGGMAGSNNLPSIQFRWLCQVFKYAQQAHPEM